MFRLKKNIKLFYSINEVAKMFDLRVSTLRFWEQEFPQLQPRKTKGGTRKYQKADIEQVALIHHLLKEKGMTLVGARQQLEHKKDFIGRKVEVLERLTYLKDELKGILNALEEDLKQQ